jgi:exodeoxyribonuclease V alpha subunit
MIDLDMMAALLRALPESTRLVLVGDKDQLASVEAGSVMGDLCHALDQRGYNPATVDWIQATTGETVTNDQAKTIDPLAQQTVMLRDSKRFRIHSGIGQMALAINGGDIRKVKAVLTGTGRGDLHWRKTSLPDSPFIHRIVVGEKGPIKAEQGFRHYLHVIQSAKPTASPTEANIADWCEQVLRAFATFQVLCAVREGEWGVNRINQRIADVLHRERLIARADGWYEGRPVMMTRNDYELGIMNGDVGIALSLPSAQGAATLKVVFRNADGSLKMLHPSRLSTVETVYAMTVHKSQGSEFGHVVFILPDSPNNPVATRELLYTGVTRARNQLTLVASQENDIILMVEKRIQRSGRLGERLQ